MNIADPNLPVTLATYIFLVRTAGHPVVDPATEAACSAFAAGGKAPEALGADLVAAVQAKLAGATAANVVEALTAIFGAVPIRTDLGAGPDREARTADVRRAHFGNHLPWLAVIVDRLANGDVGRRWVLVEAFDDAARVMDPNPWDDKDEERDIPVNDFLVQWELAGGASVRIG